MRRKREVTIIDAIDDPHLFGPAFKDPRSWLAWRVFLSALFGLPLTAEQRALFTQCTGRTTAPDRPLNEAWLVCGRRSGKSITLATIATYLATFKDWRPYLAPGERGTIMVVATDQRQARVILRYIKGLLQPPMLRSLIETERANSIDLKRGVTIEIHTASFRSTRGYTIIAALADELAFWPTSEDAAEPDVEVLAAMVPGMATIPGAMLLCASSPYARKGALWDAYKRHYGKDGDPILVWQAPTRTMNPTVPQSLIDEALARDPASAQAEYLAQFRSDIESFVSREVVEACVAHGVFERPLRSGLRYAAFVDPSGGSSDAMTLAIAHRDADQVFLDCVRAIHPPFSPESAVDEFVTTLRSYGVRAVVGDRYAGEWPREQFRKRGVTYELAAKPKSDLYRDALPLLNSRRVELLDHPQLIAQLVGLERRTARGGRDSIDHAPGGHDDIANAACGALLLAHQPERKLLYGTVSFGDSPATQLDPRTGAIIRYAHLHGPWIDVERNHDPLAPGPHNECIPGPGLSSPWLDALIFNARHNIKEPKA